MGMGNVTQKTSGIYGGSFGMTFPPPLQIMVNLDPSCGAHSRRRVFFRLCRSSRRCKSGGTY